MAADDRSLSGFPAAAAINAADLLLISEPDTQAATGFQTKYIVAADMAEGILSDLSFPLVFDTTDKTPAGAINEINGKVYYLELTGTLQAGQTQINLTGEFDPNSTIDIYTDSYGINPTIVIIVPGVGGENTISLNFEPQTAALGVKVRFS